MPLKRLIRPVHKSQIFARCQLDAFVVEQAKLKIAAHVNKRSDNPSRRNTVNEEMIEGIVVGRSVRAVDRNEARSRKQIGKGPR